MGVYIPTDVAPLPKHITSVIGSDGPISLFEINEIDIFTGTVT